MPKLTHLRINVTCIDSIIAICADAVSRFLPSGGVVSDSNLLVCPGTAVILTCSHDSSVDLTRWVITPAVTPDCNTIITHTATSNSEDMCGSYTVTMISARHEPTRSSTLELVVDRSLGGAQVTCHAGGSTSDPQVGNFTIQFIGELLPYSYSRLYLIFIYFVYMYIDSPSLPTVGTLTYSVINSMTGQVTFKASSTGSFGTGVRFYHSLLGDGSSTELTNGTITVTGLSYTEFHTVRVVATSAVCPGVLNSSSIDVPLNFNIASKISCIHLIFLFSQNLHLLIFLLQKYQLVNLLLPLNAAIQLFPSA